jgi:hypothetical protein
MKKLNIKVILLSCSVTALLLFGGWFSVQFLGQAKPIQNYVDEHEGMKIEELNVEQKNINVEISFENKPDFGVLYVDFQTFLTKIGKGKVIQLNIQQEQGEYHPWWLEHSPQLIEALHAKNYTRMEQIIKEWQIEGKLLEGKILMNSKYLFIYLQPPNEEAIHLVFPLQSIAEGGI